MDVLSSYRFMPHMCVWCLQRSENGIGYPGTVVTDDYDACEQPCRYWKASLGLLKKQPVFLIIESSLYTILLFPRKLVQ